MELFGLTEDNYFQESIGGRIVKDIINKSRLKNTKLLNMPYIKLRKKEFRALDNNFMDALMKGKLKFIRRFESDHRKSFMIEIRNNFLDLYFLGHTVEVKGAAKTGYYLMASDTFNPKQILPDRLKRIIKHSKHRKWQIFFKDIKRYPDFEKIMTAVMAKIVEHSKGNISEGVSEVNHFINNRTITDESKILIIDRQIVYPGLRESRMDLLGLKKLNNGKFGFVIIELKNKANKDIEDVFKQTQRYIDVLRRHYDDFRKTYKKVLDQKIKLRLLRSVKCDIATRKEGAVEAIVILDNYNIKSKLLGRAMAGWKQTKDKNNIKLFLKTNILNDNFFMDYNKTGKFLKRCKKAH